MGRKKIDRPCMVEGCERPYEASGYCRYHYVRLCPKVLEYNKKRNESKEYKDYQANRRENGDKRRMRNWNFQKKFGISIDDVDKMHLLQENKCAICQEKFDRLCVDHCHLTNKIRGLLCIGCNLKLGVIENMNGFYDKAISYINKYK